ncbi:MAG: fibronectin type III domain-containing protein, partial [Cytophagales bacterium]|nr:fibronectin type III domain-containing protein [Cytophagales bacterium]
ETYTIELATDPGFSNIIESTTTTENTFTPSQTEFYTSYYWRVKSDNECGASNFSEVFTFKTSCKDPANVTIADITRQSATISWTDDFSSDWEIRIIENAPTPVERNIMASTRSYNISALNSSTDYDVFVRSLCGSDFSNWIGPERFTTLVSCPAPSGFVVEDITSDAVNLSWISHGSETAWELEYGLEGFTPGTGTKILTTTNLYALEGLDEGVNYEVYLTAVCGPNTGDDDSFIIGPVQFKFPINYCEIGKFYDTGGPEGNYGENERLMMDIYSSGENIPVTVAFNAFDLAEGDLMWIFGPDVSREIYSGTDSPGTITSEKGRITVWFVASDSETSAGWDATVICGALSCPMPSGFVADNTTANTVDLSWTSNGSEPQWQLEYGVAGFAQGQGTRVLTSTNPHSLAGLSADTNYEVYLKAVCGPNSGDDDSPWVGPLDFTTPVSCPVPSDFVVDDITSDAVNLSWTSNGSEPQWELEYGVAGFVQGQGTRVLTSTNPHSLTGLSADTNY